MKKCGICKVGQWLLGIGALALGLVGVNPGIIAADINLVVRIFFILVGLAGIPHLVCQFKACPKCVDASK